jgi:hypothetical protein
MLFNQETFGRKIKIKSLIEGFQMYMGAAENEQLKFHNPPEMTPEVLKNIFLLQWYWEWMRFGDKNLMPCFQKCQPNINIIGMWVLR